jgi:hypothetical protein
MTDETFGNEYVKSENDSTGNDIESDDRDYCKKVLTMKKLPAKCGMYTHNDGSRYIGDFDGQGVKCGKGHMETPNGATYEGQFNKGLPNGLGVMRFPDSSWYEGEFMQGWFHGHGIFTTLDGTKFEGINLRLMPLISLRHFLTEQLLYIHVFIRTTMAKLKKGPFGVHIYIVFSFLISYQAELCSKYD